MRTFLFLLVVFLPAARAGAVIEGSLKLPKALRISPAATARYQTLAPVKPPDLPVGVVYLEGRFPLVENKAATVIQEGYQFRPSVLPVQKGTRVEFPNKDDEYHHVFSPSKSRKFDFGNYLKEERPPFQVFDQPGLVKLFCQIHAHMRGWILVLETPHFQRTEKDGKFRLENLPAGKFVLKAWLDENTTLERPVELKDGEVLKIDSWGK